MDESCLGRVSLFSKVGIGVAVSLLSSIGPAAGGSRDSAPPSSHRPWSPPELSAYPFRVFSSFGTNLHDAAPIPAARSSGPAGVVRRRRRLGKRPPPGLRQHPS